MKKKLMIVLSVFLLLTGIGLTVYGVTKGGYKDVKNKAVRICNECIGIG